MRLSCSLGNHSPIADLVGDRNPSIGFDGALVPEDGLVNPKVVSRWIGLSFFAAERGLGDALLTLIHGVTGLNLGS
jgi:hypothetical protein